MSEESADEFSKYELEIITRALGRVVKTLRESKFIGDTDLHFARIEELHAKAARMASGKPRREHDWQPIPQPLEHLRGSITHICAKCHKLQAPGTLDECAGPT